MVPAERIELPTFGLQNRCTTAVLRRRLGVSYYSGRHAATAIDRRSPPRFAVIFASSARHDKNATLLAHGV